MQRRLRILLPLALAVVALVGGATLFAASWLDRTLSASSVAAALSERLDREVRVRALDVHFAPLLRVRLEGLEIGSDATIEAIDLRPRLSALLRGRAEADRIEIESARLRVTRDAEGVFGLGETPTPRDPMDGARSRPALGTFGSLPEIEIDSTTVELIDLAAGPEPVRTQIQLEDFSLDPSLLTAEVELEGILHLGATGDRGELRVWASYEPGEGDLEGAVEVRALEPAALLPHLGGPADLQLAGRLEGELAARRAGSGELEANLSLELTDAAIGLAGFAASGTTGVTADVSWRDGVLALYDARLTTERLTLPDAGPDLTRVDLELETLELEGVETGSGLPRQGSLRELSLGFDREGAANRVHLGSASLRNVDEGGGNRLALDATLGLEPERTPVSLRAISAPLEPGTSLRELPFDAEIRVDPLDPEPLLHRLPAAWEVRTAGARLEAAGSLSGSVAEGFGGEARLGLASGGLTIRGIGITSPASVRGRLTTGDAGLRLDAARLEAAQATWDEHVARGVRGLLHWGDDVLTLETIDLTSYQGPLILAEQLGADGPAIHLTEADQVSAFGATGPWPLGGLEWLRVPSEGSVVGARATLVDPRSRLSGPLAVLISQAGLRGFARGDRAALDVRAALGEPPGSRGQLELQAALAPVGEPTETLSLKARFRELDPSLVLSYSPASWPLSGAPGPLDGSVAIQAFEDQRLEADLSVAAATGALGVGDVSLVAPVRWEGKLTRKQGEVSVRDGLLLVERVRVAEREAEQLRADHSLEGDTLTLAALTWRAYAGAWRQSGTIALRDPPRFDLTLGIEDVHFGQLTGFNADGEGSLLQGRAEVQGTWHGADRWLEELEGSGICELHGGTMPGSALMRAVWNALVGRVPGLGSVLKKDPQTPPARLERARLPFRLEDRRVRTDALEIVTEDYTVTAEGRLSQSLDLRLNGAVQFTAHGVSQLLSLGAVPARVRRSLALPSIPIEARGPIDAPHLSADVRRVPMATLQGILALPGRAGDAVRGVGGAVRNTGRRFTGETPDPEPQAPKP